MLKGGDVLCDEELIERAVRDSSVERPDPAHAVAVAAAAFTAEPQFDEARHLAAHPDVAAAVRQGQFRSGLQHYELHGRPDLRPLDVQIPSSQAASP